MRARVARHLGQLLDHMRGRRPVRIAHAEIDDVLAARPRRRLHRIDLGEDVGRQAADLVEIGHAGPVALTAARSKSQPCSSCLRIAWRSWS